MDKATRYEDMSADGRLSVLLQEDGDVIVSLVMPTGSRPTVMPSVEFCAIGPGGGRSPHTRQALLDLFRAIQKDNEENPQPKGLSNGNN